MLGIYAICRPTVITDVKLTVEENQKRNITLSSSSSFSVSSSSSSSSSSFSPPPPLFRCPTCRTVRLSPHTLAVWNVRFLLDNPTSKRSERRTAFVARKLARYKVGIAALRETRYSELGQLEEVGAGYTYLCSDHPKAERRGRESNFVITSSLCAPPMTSRDAARDKFYDGLLVLLVTVSKTDKLIVLVKSTALAVLSSARRRHQDQLDNNEAAINDLFSGKNRLHKAYVKHPTEDSKAAFYRSHPLVRQRLRMMQDAWTASQTEQIQGYADRSEWTMFFSAIEAVYGPQANENASFLSTNCNFLLTKMTQILQIWAENCRGVLSHTPTISDAAIAHQPQVETNIGTGLLPSLHENIRAL
nr:unnamed protein product [Spirometra erinaceieuropaei]